MGSDWRDSAGAGQALPAESGAKMRLFVGVANALHALRAKFPWNHGRSPAGRLLHFHGSSTL
jgi:hypothetical protein